MPAQSDAPDPPPEDGRESRPESGRPDSRSADGGRPPLWGLPRSTADAPLYGLSMKRRNPLAVWLGLPLITLGIYHFVWFYKVHREMADFDVRQRFSPVASLLLYILIGWTVVGFAIMNYLLGRHIADVQEAAGLRRACDPIVGTLLMFLLGAGAYYYQRELNEIIDNYGEADPGHWVPLAA